ncbi:cytochrome c biogenesis CcdA family protein [Brevibacterium luteolum]|uniref:Cytochrome c biogenesis protein CcdA n=1 Tax=Brevibacterium luteolum TaxID=199591 RepID=A0A849ALF2_9MICO|nr:cytochrome c biogenesis protein CcdA [Brevibacterium luteolum]MBM7530670.1 cytochrome c-type biogenesis protein [Brevibacterium luteolum]NNG78058.1 cytochrome c biogenesis protein CcdA [Brevibacterium luteolum]
MTDIGNTFAQTILDGPLLIAMLVAALAGAVSFASPCVLPLVPGYIGYVTGLTGTSIEDKRTSTVLGGVALFVLGFAVVFVALGTAFSGLGAAAGEWIGLLTRIMGAVVIIAGIVFMGGFGWLQRDRRLQKKPKAGLWGAPVLGATFALGWAPCIGPTLAAVLALSTGFGAEGQVWRGTLLTFVYCLGLGIPFLIVAFLLHRGAGRLAWVREHQQTIVRTGGIMLILLGLLLVTGVWNAWIQQLQGTIGDFDLLI